MNEDTNAKRFTICDLPKCRRKLDEPSSWRRMCRRHAELKQAVNIIRREYPRFPGWPGVLDQLEPFR